MLKKPKTHTLSFPTGSSYTGPLDSEGKMTGFGVYKFPNGNEYRGYFKNGFFHGRGMMIDEKKFKMCGYFINGKCNEYDIFFGDGLEFRENNWTYCSEVDRRFWVEVNQGIPPVGEGFLTKEKPSRIIPRGHYDTEEGFFDAKTGYLMDVSGLRIRHVCPDERKNILKHCRMNQIDCDINHEIMKQKEKIVASTDSWISTDTE
ncbi:MORN repeat-containing protein 5-like [Eupeodes corollae]|uniref:MORN repeat-containing protein 5-like n=1 Tax=Eupeodes corollae TaxID=290404 RepID=UPI00248F68BA|nr:MORN repeat-containing protein 5-like [Eupeodes corollae]